MRESPLLKIWDGDRLIGLEIHCPTTTSPQPTRFEEELVRIFNENERRKKAIKIVKDVKCNFPNWWWEPNIYPKDSDNPISLDECFECSLKSE